VLRKLHGLGLVALALPAWLPEVESLKAVVDVLVLVVVAKLVSVKSGKITKVLVIRIILVLVLVSFC